MRVLIVFVLVFAFLIINVNLVDAVIIKFAQKIAVPLGQQRDVKVIVENDGTGNEDVTLKLSTNQYSPAWFFNVNPATMENFDSFNILNDAGTKDKIEIIGLKSNRAAEIYIRVVGNSGNKKPLKFTYTQANTQYSMDIEVTHPQSFSGLDFFWIVFLIAFSGFVYWRVNSGRWI